MSKYKLYIADKRDSGRDGVYDLLTQDGEHLASHYCSNASFALGDLEKNRPERQEEWKKRFGDYEVLYLGDDEMTQEKLIELNHKWHEEIFKSSEV